MSVEDLRPTAFIVMPYGQKYDHDAKVEIDFDAIWKTAFEPAAERAGVRPIRADEETVGGFIHVAMFERLLLAEIVLADLTLASPNVMYELGIRHATRPRATISVFAQPARFPFDLVPIRALPYSLTPDGKIDPESAEVFIDGLAERLRVALSETVADSPLFQLIRDYPGVDLPHDVTESFQERVETILQLSSAIRRAPKRHSRKKAIRQLRKLHAQLMALPTAPTDLLIDLLLSFRDVEAWGDMIRVFTNLSAEAKRHPSPRQLLAFALNRRGRDGDRRRAIAILNDLLDQRGDDPETLGLLGRVFKDQHRRLEDRAPARARAALEAAIDCYERGFAADSRDYYPGINAIELLLLLGDSSSIRRANELVPVVAFAVGARGGITSSSYWDVATVLELAVVREDKSLADRAVRRMYSLDRPSWNYETTASSLDRLGEIAKRDEREADWISDLAAGLRAHNA